MSPKCPPPSPRPRARARPPKPACVPLSTARSLANELRGQRALLWIAGGVAVLLAAGWLYAQLALGGISGAAGKMLRDLRASNPAVADVVTPLFDSYTNRSEQTRIRKAATS